MFSICHQKKNLLEQTETKGVLFFFSSSSSLSFSLAFFFFRNFYFPRKINTKLNGSINQEFFFLVTNRKHSNPSKHNQMVNATNFPNMPKPHWEVGI